MIGKTRDQVTRVGLDILKNIDPLVSRTCSMAAPVLKKIRLLRFVEDVLKRCENDVPGDDHLDFGKALIEAKLRLYPVLFDLNYIASTIDARVRSNMSECEWGHPIATFKSFCFNTFNQSRLSFPKMSGEFHATSMEYVLYHFRNFSYRARTSVQPIIEELSFALDMARLTEDVTSFVDDLKNGHVGRPHDVVLEEVGCRIFERLSALCAVRL